MENRASPHPSCFVSAVLPPLEAPFLAGQSMHVLVLLWAAFVPSTTPDVSSFVFEQHPCPLDILPFCWQQRLWLSLLFYPLFYLGASAIRGCNYLSHAGAAASS